MEETSLQNTYLASLAQAGLTQDQAIIYECLIKNGVLPAGKISQKTPLKRGLVYKLLDEMVGMGLAIKHDEPGKVAIFEPAHPLKLKELAEKREEEAKQAQSVLSSILNPLVLDYNAQSSKPGVLFLSGIDGIKRVYDLIIEKRAPIKIFASNIDRGDPELSKLIDKQVQRQHGHGITTLSLGSTTDLSLSPEQIKSLGGLGVTIKKLNDFLLPSQIIVFGDSVAISALTPELVTTYIQNTAIAQALNIIFMQLWQRATPLQLQSRENDGPQSH